MRLAWYQAAGHAGGDQPWRMTGVAWIFVASTFTTFVFSFGIGANDVANRFCSCRKFEILVHCGKAEPSVMVAAPARSFGTSVGSGALTLRQTALIAAVCELSGALTLGAGVRPAAEQSSLQVYHRKVPRFVTREACRSPIQSYARLASLRMSAAGTAGGRIPQRCAFSCLVRRCTCDTTPPSMPGMTPPRCLCSDLQ